MLLMDLKIGGCALPMPVRKNPITVTVMVSPMNRNSLFRVIFLIALSISWATGLQAKVYRWVDENGGTIYSQTPPPGQVEAETIAPPPPPPTDANETWENLNQQWQEMQDREDARKDQKEEATKGQENQEARTKNCQAAQYNLERLVDGRFRMRIKEPDGGYRRLPAEERQARIEKARQVIQDNCD